jgi:hypothetical protein
MNHNARVAAVIVAIVAVAAGGLYYFFGVWKPAAARKAAAAEVTTWDDHWVDARTCIAGTASMPGTIAQALAIRHLEHGSESASCSTDVANISRGEAPNSGFAEVEQAWAQIDHAAQQVATAYAAYVDPRAADGNVLRKLDAAIQAMDAARIQLRATVGLDTPAAPRAALADAKLIPIVKDGCPLVENGQGQIFNDRGDVLYGTGCPSARELYEVRIVPGTDPRVVQITSSGMRGTPDDSWGLAFGPSAISIGALDPTGQPAGPVNTDPVHEELGTESLAVVGSLEDGAAAWISGGKLTLATVRAGKISATQRIPASAAVGARDLTAGTSAIAWSDATAHLHGAFARAGKDVTFGAPVELGIGDLDPDHVCVAEDHAWFPSRGALFTFDAAGDKSSIAGHAQLVACDPAGAILRTDEPKYLVCSDACRTVALPAGFAPQAVVLIGPSLHVAAAYVGVMAIWREQGKPIYVGVPVGFTPRGAFTDHEVIDVVGVTPDRHLQLARVPLATL